MFKTLRRLRTGAFVVGLVGALLLPAIAHAAKPIVLTYTATGTATGPFPGTFVEEGRVMLGEADPPNPGLAVLKVKASFEITSGSTLITGTKKSAPAPSAGNVCLGDAPSPGDRQVVVNSGDLHYSATLHTPTGTSQDEGDASIALNELRIGGVDLGTNFEERLMSTDPLGPFQPAEFLNATGSDVTIRGSCG